MRKCKNCGGEISKTSKGLCKSCFIKKRTIYPRDKGYYQRNYIDRGLTLEELAIEMGNYNIAKSGKLTRIITGLGFSIRKRTDNQWGSDNNQWRGGRTPDAAGYILLKMRDYPSANSRGYVREHIFVWEQANGKAVPDGWHVHHINGIKDDNRIENLQAIPAWRHASLNLLDWNKVIHNYKEEIASLKKQNKELRACMKYR